MQMGVLWCLRRLVELVRLCSRLDVSTHHILNYGLGCIIRAEYKIFMLVAASWQATSSAKPYLEYMYN